MTPPAETPDTIETEIVDVRPAIETEIIRETVGSTLTAPPPVPEAVRGPGRPREYPEIRIEASWDAVKRYSDAAAKLSRATTALQVMAGFELMEIKARYHQPGRRTDLAATSTHRASRLNGSVDSEPLKGQQERPIGFQEACQLYVGISHDTARRWISMAEAVKPRLKKLPGLGHLIAQILERPIAELSADDSRLLEQAVHKVADGRTQTDFLIELGIVKNPGNPNPGGGPGGSKPRGLPDDETILKAAREDWVATYRLLFRNPSFTTLPSHEIEATIDMLDRHVKARKLWLRTPAHERNADLIRQITESIS